MATVSLIPAKEVVARTAIMLGVSESDEEQRLVQIIGQALRRAAFVLSPCARHELERAVLQSLSGLVASPADELASRIHHALEQLLVFGEIFEMKAPDDDIWRAAPLILRPAPPSFVRRADGSLVILGVAGDDITPLTSDLTEQLRFHSQLRILPATQDDVSDALQEMGLIELSERSWLRLPPVETPTQFLQSYRQALREAPRTGAVEGLRVLDSSRSPQFYRDRWIEPKPGLDGVYVARRPQKYGAALWCLVEMAGGTLDSLIDLVSPADRERPCDLAWRLHTALDAERGIPQKFAVQTSRARTRFDFYSPLPSWAERALAVSGERAPPERCLITFLVPESFASEKSRMLKDLLWMEETRI